MENSQNRWLSLCEHRRNRVANLYLCIVSGLISDKNKIAIWNSALL